MLDDLLQKTNQQQFMSRTNGIKTFVKFRRLVLEIERPENLSQMQINRQTEF